MTEMAKAKDLHDNLLFGQTQPEEHRNIVHEEVSRKSNAVMPPKTYRAVTFLRCLKKTKSIVEFSCPESEVICSPSLSSVLLLKTRVP